MADVQAWANQIAQQLFDGPQDLANEAAANVTDASGLAFFVGKPNGSSGQWTLKKLTPTELGKLVYNYLTTQSIAQQFASVLGDVNIISSIKADGSVDLNNVIGNINYYFDDSRPLNSPGGVGYGLFEQKQKGRLRYQEWLDWSTSEAIVYYRYLWNTNNVWTPSGAWRKVTTVSV